MDEFIRNNEVELQEFEHDQSVRLEDLRQMLPSLQKKYGKFAVLRFSKVAIAPTSKQRLRGDSYG